MPRPHTRTPQESGQHRAIHGDSTAGPGRRLACRVGQVGALRAGGEALFGLLWLVATALAGTAERAQPAACHPPLRGLEARPPAQPLNPARHVWHGSVR